MSKTFKITVTETVEHEVFVHLDDDDLADIRDRGRGFTEDRWAVLSHIRHGGAGDHPWITEDLKYSGYGKVLGREINTVEEMDWED